MDIRSSLYILMTAAVLSTAAVSCDDDLPAVILGQKASDDSGSGGSGINTLPSEYLKRYEVPQLSDNGIFIEHSALYGSDSVMTYCLEYDASAMHSRWVAFRFDNYTGSNNVGRSNEPFTDDPDLPSACRIGSNGFGSAYYDVSGNYQQLPSNQFDRGHLCASADRYMSTAANEQTFYMSNMSPQMSKFNSPYWSAYEAFVQNRGRSSLYCDTLYVVKGGTIGQGQTLGYVPRTNGAKVTIPKYYFMALLKCKNNTFEAIGFWMEHKVYDAYTNDAPPTSEIAAHAVTIDELELHTGIDFFHNLPDNIEQSVEASYTLSNWGL